MSIKLKYSILVEWSIDSSSAVIFSFNDKKEVMRRANKARSGEEVESVFLFLQDSVNIIQNKHTNTLDSIRK